MSQHPSTPRTPTPAAAPQAPDVPGHPTAAWLANLRRTAKAMLIAQRLGWVLAWALAAVLVAGAADYILRTPVAMRMVLWVAGALTLAALLRRVVWPALRFRPSLTEVALRVEQSPPGREAGLEGLLASGLELAAAREHPRLADPVIEEARRRIGTLGAARLLAPTRTVRSLVWLGAALGAVLVVAAMEPGLARIGASRILWPVAGAQWPRRTGVTDITEVRVHPLGSALALRAAVWREAGNPGALRVAANYRLYAGKPGSDPAGPVRQVLLTSQDRYVRLESGATVENARSTGMLFERLIEPSGLGSDTAGARARSRDRAPSEMTLEYWFQTEDDQSEPVRVLLVEPPQVVGAQARVELPPYAAGMLDRFPDLARGQGTLDLGPGSDERAAAPPVLAGSRVTLRIELNKAVPGLSGEAAAWAARTLGPEAAALLGKEESRAALSTDGPVWTLSWTLSDPLRLSVKPVDEHGIAGAEEATYRFDALRDNPPSVVITQPLEDKAVLATAVVDLAAEARDDVGLSWITLERQVARKAAGTEGGAPEPTGERTAFGRVEPEAGGDARRLVSKQTLDLTELEVKVGDEVWITGAATDAFELAGARHETVRSGVRKLRIMSREELVQQIWGELGAVRRTAMKIDEDQKEIARGVNRAGAEDARRSQRAQTGLTERLARQAEGIDDLESRIKENGLTDQGLSEVLDRARSALDKAGQQSGKASDDLGKAEKAESADSPPPEAGKEERKSAAEAQQQVREELGRLIDMLDQGEDTYAAKRALEQVLGQQKSLRDRTEQTGAHTTGKSAEQLSPQQKQDLQQLAQEQMEASKKLREAIDKMMERQQKLEKNDAAAAQQMEQAAKRGQRDRVAEKMQEAAQQIQQNQGNKAQQQQSQAIQSLEQMLKELDKTSQARDEVLKRYLASLIESLRALIAQQESRLAELEAAIPDKAFAGLDAPMLRLHQATLGVLDEAKGAPREAADALALVDRAADAQSAAVVGLRDQPVNADEVQSQEQLSLDKLNQALDLAQKLSQAAEQREQDRKRAELRAKYEEALKTQVSIRESTLGLVNVEATRRTRATARQLGADQETLRASMEALREQTKELKDARVFDYAHTRLNDLMTAAAGTLNSGEATADAARRQAAAARVLASLVEALDDQKKDDKKFREREQDQAGGGGGSGSEPLVPPAAEIKLLRSMQIEAAERTREVGDGKAESGAVDEVMKLQRDLADQAKALLDRLKQQGPGGPKAAPGGPEPEPSDPAKPPSEPDKPGAPTEPAEVKP